MWSTSSSNSGCGRNQWGCSPGQSHFTCTWMVSSPTLCTNLPLKKKERISWSACVTNRHHVTACAWAGVCSSTEPPVLPLCRSDRNAQWPTAGMAGAWAFLASQMDHFTLHDPHSVSVSLLLWNWLGNCRTTLSYYSLIPAASWRIY